MNFEELIEKVNNKL